MALVFLVLYALHIGEILLDELLANFAGSALALYSFHYIADLAGKSFLDLLVQDLDIPLQICQALGLTVAQHILRTNIAGMLGSEDLGINFQAITLFLLSVIINRQIYV